MQIYTDQLQREIGIQSKPQRIISLVPSLTELLFDLGLEKQIVGITQFCVHPYHLKSTKTIVGGTKKVDVEIIKQLNPDFILCAKEENTPEMVDELEKIAPVFVADINSINDSLGLIELLGKILYCQTATENLLQKIDFQLQIFKNFTKYLPKKKVAYFIWGNPWMVAGGNCYINDLLKLNNFINVYEDKGRYPEIIIEHIRKDGNPKIVFLPTEPCPFNDEHAFEIGRHSNHAKTVFVDGQMFSWYGSRLLKAIPYFKKMHELL
ncbi:MAG: helical backbone metal receptor [Flavobacteriaceae bacterium]|jgi:ABC-type Fe3+-hydroxamate transport system substrate-binding protein|nr:helical backbone metal receptor [Flavobacteriaceae bacterium]